jgi:hypothetical protein
LENENDEIVDDGITFRFESTDVPPPPISFIKRISSSFIDCEEEEDDDDGNKLLFTIPSLFFFRSNE